MSENLPSRLIGHPNVLQLPICRSSKPYRSMFLASCPTVPRQNDGLAYPRGSPRGCRLLQITEALQS